MKNNLYFGLHSNGYFIFELPAFYNERLAKFAKKYLQRNDISHFSLMYGVDPKNMDYGFISLPAVNSARIPDSFTTMSFIQLIKWASSFQAQDGQDIPIIETLDDLIDIILTDEGTQTVLRN